MLRRSLLPALSFALACGGAPATPSTTPVAVQSDHAAASAPPEDSRAVVCEDAQVQRFADVAALCDAWRARFPTGDRRWVGVECASEAVQQSTGPFEAVGALYLNVGVSDLELGDPNTWEAVRYNGSLPLLREPPESYDIVVHTLVFVRAAGRVIPVLDYIASSLDQETDEAFDTTTSVALEDDGRFVRVTVSDTVQTDEFFEAQGTTIIFGLEGRDPVWRFEHIVSHTGAVANEACLEECYEQPDYSDDSPDLSCEQTCAANVTTRTPLEWLGAGRMRVTTQDGVDTVELGPCGSGECPPVCPFSAVP